MRLVAGVAILLAAGMGSAMAGELASECPGHPDALGTSRVLTISPDDFKRIGSIQYQQSLPLADHEVVLTFDDGPIPPYSNSILDTLDSQCVKATYFMVGERQRLLVLDATDELEVVRADGEHTRRAERLRMARAFGRQFASHGRPQSCGQQKTTPRDKTHNVSPAPTFAPSTPE